MTAKYDPSIHMLVAVYPETGEHVHVPLPDLITQVHVVEREMADLPADVADAMREMADQIVTLRRQVYELQQVIDALQSIEIYRPKDAA